MQVRAQDPEVNAAPLWLPQAGERVGERFLVEGILGRGGMGAVFRARDLERDAIVALKLVSKSSCDAYERFAREARVLSTLAHPAIVRYVAHGVSERGAPYLAMEWLEGADLAQTLVHTRLSPSQSVALVRRVCEGLAVAHARGIVHRDLKPSNLFVVGGDVFSTKLLDFGVARARSGMHTMTRGGTVLGTVGYMAPEQALGRFDVDASADVFSLGCVLFECLTGRAAFLARHDVAVLAKVLREEPPRVSEICPELGDTFDALVAAMLQKERAERPRDAAALLDALDSQLPSRPTPHTTLPTLARLTASERRIASIVLARRSVAAATLDEHAASDAAARLDQLVARFGARVVPLAGDGLMFTFSGDEAATDQASRAASCALALKRLRPDLHVSVTTGPREGASLPIGDEVDRAAPSLDGGAAAGVRLDELTEGLLDRRYDVQRTPAGRVLFGELDDLEVPRPLLDRRTPCVGRDKELGLLEATFEEVIEHGVARSVVVSGVPGIGKSRLARTLLDRLRGKGKARLIVARAEAIAVGSALSLTRRLLRRAASLHGADPRAVQRVRLAEYLSTLPLGEDAALTLELAAELLDLNESHRPSPMLRAARHDPAVMHTQIERTFARWIAAECARQPLVVLIEDLHWADAASVAQLERSLAQLSERPLLLVVLGRPDLRERFPRLLELAGAQEIRLAGLTRRAAERLARFVLPDHDQATLARVVERADGNAFYLEELLRHVAEGITELPVTVLAMAQSRLERLDGESRRVLRAASVFGASSSAKAVASLLGASDLRDELELLARREILVRRREPRAPDEPEYEFRHALLRDAAYASLTGSDRRVAHRMAGYYLEREGTCDARVLADHFERGQAEERARFWLTRAALDALEAGDFDGALELASRALALGAAGEQRGTLLLLQGYVAAFRTAPERERLREALALLPKATPHWWLALSTLIFAALAEGRPDDVLPYVQLAMETPPGAELTGAYGAALQAMCVAMVIYGRADLAWSALERFDRAADDEASDPLFVAWLDLARSQLATTSPERGSWQLGRGLTWVRRAVASMRKLGSSSGLTTGLFYLGYTTRVLGLYDEAEAALCESIALAERSGNLLVVQYAKLISALALLRRGADAALSTLLEELSHSRDATVAQGAHAVRAAACFRQGQLTAARDHARRAAAGPSAPYRRFAFTTLARALLALGDAAAALATVERALSEHGAATPEYAVDLLLTRADAARARGEDVLAQDSMREARALAEAAADSIDDPDVRAAFAREIEPNARALALVSR